MMLPEPLPPLSVLVLAGVLFLIGLIILWALYDLWGPTDEG